MPVAPALPPLIQLGPGAQPVEVGGVAEGAVAPAARGLDEHPGIDERAHGLARRGLGGREQIDAPGAMVTIGCSGSSSKRRAAMTEVVFASSTRVRSAATSLNRSWIVPTASSRDHRRALEEEGEPALEVALARGPRRAAGSTRRGAA